MGKRPRPAAAGPHPPSLLLHHGEGGAKAGDLGGEVSPVLEGYVVTCEHASHEVPAEWRHLFDGHDDVLRSHRGWDPGAHEIGRRLAQALGAPYLATEVTRLLVECNRSERHPRLFSEFSRDLPLEQRQQLMERYYRPHRRRVARAIEDVLRTADVAIHVGVHSFTPIWEGEERRVDVGLLYDPGSPLERDLCARWRDELRRVRPDLRIRRNTPYRGVSDGLTKTLRRVFGTERYVGIELEVSQGLVSSAVQESAHRRDEVRRAERLADEAGSTP